MIGCGCRQCRYLIDQEFERITEGLDLGAPDLVERIREYGDAPRAQTPEDFEAWLQRIIDRAHGRRNEGS